MTRVIYQTGDDGPGGFDVVRVEEDGRLVCEVTMASEEFQPLLEDAAAGALDRLIGELEQHR